ncbi:MAG: LacI family DNA-binding transcriptional regulator [Phycisphaeraceae bacterium]
MQATLSQIAEEAGVSVSLVSRLLRSDKTLRVTTATRRKVLQAERRLGGARVRTRIAPVGARRRSIIVPINRVYETQPVQRLLVESISGTFLRNFEQRLTASDYRLGFTFFDEHRKLEEFEQTMQSGGFCDGLLLLSGVVNEAVAEQLVTNRYPHVAIGEQGERFAVNSVSAYAAGGIKQAVAHLRELGHTQIAYAGAGGNESRFGLFLAALATEGLPVRSDGHCDLSPQGPDASVEQWCQQIRGEIAQWLDHPTGVTALICSNDTVALAVRDAAHQKGLRVGRDLSIVGYDNAEVHGPHQVERPILTTIDNPVEQIGLRCADLLIAQVEGRHAGVVHEQIPTRFIVRESTGPVPG